MSAPWSLCNYSCGSCCRKNKAKNSPHLYCGCQASNRRLKMYAEHSHGDVDRQSLIARASEAVDYDYVDKEKKDEWEIVNPVSSCFLNFI